MSFIEISSPAKSVHFPRPLEAVVFDCDGVLFDSKEANVQFYNHILSQIGYRSPVRQDQCEYIHMHPVRESLRYLVGDGDLFGKAWHYAQQMDFWPFNRYLRCEPGLLEILELAKSSFRTALATNRTVSTRQVLAYFDIEKYFDLVVSASDVRHPKPHPEIMERILEAFSVSPEAVLFVGDSQVDEAFAHATGVVFAAYKNHKLKAHLHISHFRELHAILSSEQSVANDGDLPSNGKGTFKGHFPG